MAPAAKVMQQLGGAIGATPRACIQCFRSAWSQWPAGRCCRGDSVHGFSRRVVDYRYRSPRIVHDGGRPSLIESSLRGAKKAYLQINPRRCYELRITGIAWTSISMAKPTKCRPAGVKSVFAASTNHLEINSLSARGLCRVVTRVTLIGKGHFQSFFRCCLLHLARQFRHLCALVLVGRCTCTASICRSVSAAVRTLLPRLRLSPSLRARGPLSHRTVIKDRSAGLLPARLCDTNERTKIAHHALENSRPPGIVASAGTRVPTAESWSAAFATQPQREPSSATH
ncbi:hypothetical protein QFZ98_004932 [Paraburkholderia youngii]